MNVYTMEYKCNDCGNVVRLAKAPRFCPFCGSESIERDLTKARANAFQLIESCNKLAAEMEPIFNAYLEKMAQYEWNMQTLRTYKMRGIITEEELPKYRRPQIQRALAEYRRRRKAEK